MNKLEKIFIDSGTVWEDDAKECANITEELMVELLDFISNKESKYSIMYGNQKERFSTEHKDFTIKQIIDIFLKEKYGK